MSFKGKEFHTMSIKVLISDSFSQEGIDILEQADGFEVVYKTGMSEDELCAAIEGMDALIIRSATTVTKKVLEAADKLKVVARAGVGTDNVDKKAATDNGVIVMNAPSGNSISTAELALALLFSLARKIPQANASMKASKWEKKKFGGVQITGKKIGIIGLGRIGQELAKRCYSCGMDVLGYDPFLSGEQIRSIGAEPSELENIFKTADFISTHVPLTDKTKGLIGKKEIGMMKPTTMLINCARGGIMVEEDVAEAVKEGKLAGAAFDVFNEEPPKDSPFVGVDNIIMTPHLGASTGEAQVKVAMETSQEIIDFFNKGIIKNSVNVPPLDQKLRQEMAPYFLLSEKLGRFVSGLMNGSIDEVIVTYSGNMMNKEVYFLTQSVLKGLLEPMMDTALNFVNAPILAKERGIRVSERKETIEPDFTDLISVKVKGPAGEHELWGTIYGRDDIRFVHLDGYYFDLKPEGNVLVVHNNDVPGVVGIIGTILGEARVNIASMKLGRKEKGSNVLTIVSIDDEIKKDTMEKIISSEPIRDAAVVPLV